MILIVSFLRDEELSYALGKDGSTRKKIEQASGAILQYVGNVAYIGGTQKERKRCRDYVNWLLQQRRGNITISDVSRRDDVTEVRIPENCKGWVTGNRGSEMRRMEQDTGTFMFIALDSRGEERLLIFGSNVGSKNSSGGRSHAERLVNELVNERLRSDDFRRGRGRSDSRRPETRRRRTPPRRTSSRSPSWRSPPRGERQRSWD